ncbi:DUF1223 domain-containing protein [Methylovirgula sp. 4M-Z18]|uniref:DUF1223 domain-containing protein n=1 Tax=Methylovirgula sp. 4M-Z18 TaxID=2293567 RepID=UPI000E2F154A|nr:DUF1223 domain-containing protein [Methylovirgula sp. 4M-Z18]RFB79470.1 DUF1223 domain-containing protein [Methylovirgula sp. 4M-Z18]
MNIRKELRRVWLGVGGSALLAAAFFAPYVQAGDAPRAVVELFTSQGCSSCPPADRLMGELAKNPQYVAMSWPVDYWDYMGWKDTLASPLFTGRQKAYAEARGDGQIYTPQAVIDGLTHVVGSDSGAIQSAGTALQGQHGALSVAMTLSETPNGLHVMVAGATAESGTSASLWLLHITKSKAVAIGRGENSGHTVTYTNVVRAFAKIGDWTGAPASYTIPAAQLKAPDAEGYVLLLQAGAPTSPGVILAAAKSANL